MIVRRARVAESEAGGGGECPGQAELQPVLPELQHQRAAVQDSALQEPPGLRQIK